MFKIRQLFFIWPTKVYISDVFGHMAYYLYAIDTITNVFPSIHVFNTIAIQTAIRKSDTLRCEISLLNWLFFDRLSNAIFDI